LWPKILADPRQKIKKKPVSGRKTPVNGCLDKRPGLCKKMQKTASIVRTFMQ
jgi:hypothetical protein